MDSARPHYGTASGKSGWSFSLGMCGYKECMQTLQQKENYKFSQIYINLAPLDKTNKGCGLQMQGRLTNTAMKCTRSSKFPSSSTTSKVSKLSNHSLDMESPNYEKTRTSQHINVHHAITYSANCMLDMPSIHEQRRRGSLLPRGFRPLQMRFEV